MADAECLPPRRARRDRQQSGRERHPAHRHWKKNWLFIGEANAGDRGAILYTIVESCRRRGLDPYRYLRELLTALPTMTNWQLKDWTPETWAKRNSASRKVA